MHGYVLVVWKPLTQSILWTGKDNFLKQEVKNHVKIVTLAVPDFIKESTSVSVNTHLNFNHSNRYIMPVGFNIVSQIQ